MNNKNDLRKGAVVASIFAVLIISSASAVVPAVNGSAVNHESMMSPLQKNKLNLLDVYAKKQNLEDVSYDEIFYLLENKINKGEGRTLLNLLYRLDHAVNEKFDDGRSTVFPVIFRYIQNSMESLDLTKPGAYAVFTNKMNLLKKQIQNVATTGVNTDGKSPSTKTFISEIGNIISRSNNEKISPLYIPPTNHYFDWWWHYYEKLLEKMANDGDFISYEDWYLYASTWTQTGWISSEVGFGLILSVCVALMGSIIPGLSLMAWFIAWASFAFYAGVMIHFLDVKAQYDRLWTKEIDIALRVKDQEGNWINDLNIIARSKNVSDLNLSEPGKRVQDFTYDVNQAYGYEVNDDGWYALSSTEDPFDRTKPPYPPGIWEIIIPTQIIGGKKYLDTTITTDLLAFCGIYINDNITLYCSEEGYPYITNVNPSPGQMGVDLNPELSFKINDDEQSFLRTSVEAYDTNLSPPEWISLTGESLWLNATGSILAINTSDFNIFTEYNTTYKWRVYVEDVDPVENHWILEELNFTTKLKN